MPLFQRLHCLVWIAATLLVLAGAVAAHAADQPAASAAAPRTESTDGLDSNVLVLVAGSYGSGGVDAYVTELVNGLKKHGIAAADVHVEYLDAVHNDAPTYRAALGRLLTAKYAQARFDLVFCVQQPALDFLLEQAPALAARSVVFSRDANLPPKASVPAGTRFVFQTAALDYKGTLERALELFPATERVLLVQGNTPLDAARLEGMRQQLAPWVGKLQFDDTHALSYEELDTQLQALPPRTVILGVNMARDAKGETLNPSDSRQRIMRHANAPVFVYFDSGVGNGPLGGMVARFDVEARKAVDVALDILQGRRVLDQPVTLLPPMSIPMFDWQQVVRWGADPAVLPANTLFVNRPQTLWSQYRSAVLAGGAAIAVLSAMVLALVVQNRRRKQAEKSVKELNTELEARVHARTQDLETSSEELRHTLDQLRKAQGQLVQTEKLAALGSLVAGVAHELNTPIGNCLVVASSLQDRVQQFARKLDAGPLRRSQLQELVQGAGEAAELLQRGLRRSADIVSSFKRVSADQSSGHRQRFELHSALQDTATLLQVSLRKTPYQFTMDVPLGIVLDSYPGFLEQVVTNLVNNALTHAFAQRDYGSMHLRARLQGDSVELLFRDDGHGMSEQTRERIFEPFFTTKLGQGGSGLGMSICYNLVTGPLGGSIAIDSAPQAGCSVVVVLPLSPAESTS